MFSPSSNGRAGFGDLAGCRRKHLWSPKWELERYHRNHPEMMVGAAGLLQASPVLAPGPPRVETQLFG